MAHYFIEILTKIKKAWKQIHPDLSAILSYLWNLTAEYMITDLIIWLQKNFLLLRIQYQNTVGCKDTVDHFLKAQKGWICWEEGGASELIIQIGLWYQEGGKKCQVSVKNLGIMPVLFAW